MTRQRLAGELILPQDEGYDTARRVWNTAYDRRPLMIARVRDAADVIQAVRFARAYDLPLAVRAGGHSMAGYGAVDCGVVVDLSRMKGMSIDSERRVAWAQTGLTAGEYGERAQEYGLATPFGDAGTVGIAGLTLGGGIGYLARKHGLAVDSLLSAEVVTADGRLLTASETEHPDLFWALRGGGGVRPGDGGDDHGPRSGDGLPLRRDAAPRPRGGHGPRPGRGDRLRPPG